MSVHLQPEISIHFAHFRFRRENLSSTDTTFVRVILFSEMLPKTISDYHITENFNAVRPIIKSTERRKRCALVPYGSLLKAHLSGLNW